MRQEARDRTLGFNRTGTCNAQDALMPPMTAHSALSFRSSSPPFVTIPHSAVCCPATEWVMAKRAHHSWNAARSTTPLLRTATSIRYADSRFHTFVFVLSYIFNTLAFVGSPLVRSIEQASYLIIPRHSFWCQQTCTLVYN